MMIINPYRFSAGGSTLLLDETGLGSAHGAYSVARKLRGAYSGSAIRVRRSSDNAEQDIGFSSDVLDESALTTFIGANDGFIVTIYDQSGNTKDATQSNTSDQAKIVSSGTVTKDNGKPAAELAVGNYYAYSGGTISAQTAVSILGVFNASAAAGTSNIKYAVGIQGTTSPVALRYGKTGNSSFENKLGMITNGSTNAALSSAANTNQLLGIGVGNGTALSFYENNNAEVSTTDSTLSFTNDAIGLAAKYDGAFVMGADYWQEGVIWLSDKEAYVSTVKSNVNGFYSIY